MFTRSTLALFAAAILLACGAPQTNKDVHDIGLRNAKLHAKEQLKMDVDNYLFQIIGDIDNNEWTRYWNRVEEYNDTEPTQWNDKIHTLYAYYFVAADAKAGEAVWIFVHRRDGTLAGVMRTGRQHRSKFGTGGGSE